MIVLIDSGNTHNFIDRREWPKKPALNFQTMIGNSGMVKCGGLCENVKLKMGEHCLKSHSFSLEMVDCDVDLGAEWLGTL